MLLDSTVDFTSRVSS